MSVPVCAQMGPADLALTYLRLAQRELQLRRQKRDYFVSLAREKGVTHQRIADVLGVTEGAVRAMLKRAGGA